MVQILQHMDPQLHRAAREGNIELLEEIVKGQPELSGCLTPQKNTVLHIAVRFGKEDVAKRLIKLCEPLISQPNSKGDTPLHLAAGAGHQSLAELLTGGGAWRMRNSQGNRAIHEAVKRGHEKVAMHLLELERAHGVMHDVNGAGESLLYLAAEAGLEEFVEKIVGMGPHAFIPQGPDRQTPLHIAVIRGRLGIVNHLLGVNRELTKQVDCFGKTALHHSASLCYDKEEKQIKILEKLLTAGSALADKFDTDGNSPLLIAVRKGHVHAVSRILVCCPKSAKHVDGGGQNALHLAVTKNGGEMLGYLLRNHHELKELINELDYDGNTPMHLASKNKYCTLVGLLLQCEGVDLAVTNKDGLTALDAFGSNQLTDQQEECRQKLMKHGAVHSRYTTLQLADSRDKAPDLFILPNSDLKSMVNTLAVLATLVAGITFAAAMATPGGYKNEAPDEGLPVLIRTAAMKAFLFTDAAAFCAAIMMSIVLVFAFYNKASPVIVVDLCLSFAATTAGATIIAFMTGVYALTSKESPWLAILVLLMGCSTIFLSAFFESDE